MLVLALVLGACSSSSLPKDPTDAMRALLPGRTALSGFTLKDTAVVYERNTVWDHLGQQAEIYLNNGIDKLSTATYVAANSAQSLTVDLMMFQEPVNAFTMYALNRKPEAQFLDIPTEGYLLGDTLAFLKGKYVGKIWSSGNVANDDLEKAARTISEKITDTSTAIPEQLALFPAEGRVAHSESKLLRNQDHHEETPEFYGCQYVENSDTITLYFMLNSRIGLSTATETFLGNSGSIDEWLMEGQYQSLAGKHPDRGAVFCAQHEGTLAVVTGYTDRKAANALVERLFSRVSGQ